MKSSSDLGVNATTLLVAPEVVYMLNSDALSPVDFDSIMKRRQQPMSVGDLMSEIKGKPELPPEWKLPSPLVTVARLRQLVDEWIATGFASDGGDSPRQRELIRARGAFAAVKACAATNPCKLHFLEKAAELVVVVGVPPAWSGPNLIDPLGGAIGEADRIFTSMMTSEWKNTVCKCRLCGRYFVRKKLRRSYRHGVFCTREHQRHASAAACTSNRRLAATRELIDYAANWLLKQSVKDRRWQDNAALKYALAGAISVKLERTPSLRVSHQGVKVNWVTWNAGEIEKRRRILVTLR